MKQTPFFDSTASNSNATRVQETCTPTEAMNARAAGKLGKFLDFLDNEMADQRAQKSAV
ncbi:hypothetical protein SAMN05444287_2010 [Octadecabacter temperatus]|jgi:hypothetical protein|uniref:Uncharacterized protein n=1 Tax=Octadecabacter temperatus TaxID=1458307 RepID=A0A0K0Y7M5_9RHOB|nr:hypothetical protein [Octadecabacter temperatus]AKS46886.1 hypothetical protein OSB_23500 [Octadecabacter temperatus]SIO23096.1 hypothetical protein SAMN05444287_2010 [Octadecabacter temperatus]